MRVRFHFLVAVGVCLAIANLMIVPVADAHAVLVESSPALNGQAAGPNVPIKLRFNVRIDAMRSRLTLVCPDGSTQALEIGKEAAAEVLTSQAKGLTPGQYRIRWQVLASDGHLTRGEIPFTVTKP